MAKTGLTKAANIDTTAREIDFVSRFTTTWEDLRNIMGISRLVRKAPGTQLIIKSATVTLADSVGEGEEIPYSQATVTQDVFGTINVEKYAKAVSIEAINENGYDDAIGLTDDQFLFELTSSVLDKYYSFLQNETKKIKVTKGTFQAALAEAQGQVRNKWKTMRKGITEVVGFCNILDAYDYLGAANITVQSEFGLNYIENFLGYRRLFLCAASEVPRNKVYATPVENLVQYYVSPDDSDFARAGLVYTTDGVTNLIGFHTQGDYKTAVSEAFALLGTTVLAEYEDGIAAVTIGA